MEILQTARHSRSIPEPKFTGPSRTVAVDRCPRDRDRIAGFAPLQPFPTAKSGGRSFWLPNHSCRAESPRRLSCSRVTLVQSHATADNATAVALHVWLREHGFEDVFLDAMPECGADSRRGLAGGAKGGRPSLRGDAVFGMTSGSPPMVQRRVPAAQAHLRVDRRDSAQGSVAGRYLAETPYEKL
jgi:hypothetical protein